MIRESRRADRHHRCDRLAAELVTGWELDPSDLLLTALLHAAVPSHLCDWLRAVVSPVALFAGDDAAHKAVEKPKQPPKMMTSSEPVELDPQVASALPDQEWIKNAP